MRIIFPSEDCAVWGIRLMLLRILESREYGLYSSKTGKEEFEIVLTSGSRAEALRFFPRVTDEPSAAAEIWAGEIGSTFGWSAVAG
jgi:hypothetical protein